MLSLGLQKLLLFDCFLRDHLHLDHFIYGVNGWWLLAVMEEYFS